MDEPRAGGRRVAGTLRASATRTVVRAPRDPRASRRDFGTGAGQPVGTLRASTRVSGGLAVFRGGGRVQPDALGGCCPDRSLPRRTFRRFGSETRKRGGAFLDSLDAETLQHPEVLHARAELEYWAQYSLEDPAYVDTSLATLATLRARWPDHVSGYFRAAEYLYQEKPQEALALIEEAVRLAPGSAHVRYLHWQILNETDQLPAEERRTAIEDQHHRVSAGRAGDRTRPRPAHHGL